MDDRVELHAPLADCQDSAVSWGSTRRFATLEVTLRHYSHVIEGLRKERAGLLAVPEKVERPRLRRAPLSRKGPFQLDQIGQELVQMVVKDWRQEVPAPVAGTTRSATWM